MNRNWETNAEVFATLPDVAKKALATVVFEILDGADEWNSDTLQSIGDAFAQRGILW